MGVSSVESRGKRRSQSLGWILSVSILLSVLTAWGSVPAFGLWLPWATEEDKIGKRLNDIWTALLAKDVRSLKRYLGGSAVQPFIDRELEAIRTQGITGYRCAIGRVQFDSAGGEFAFVEYDRFVTTADGRTVAGRAFHVFRKIRGDWKLITGLRSRRRSGRGGQYGKRGRSGESKTGNFGPEGRLQKTPREIRTVPTQRKSE